MVYSWKNALHGAIIYSTGDSIASLVLGEFQTDRMFGMMLVGATVYALEIPNYFLWLDKRTDLRRGWAGACKKTLWALAYFNPVWIARHLLFIRFFGGHSPVIGWELLWLGSYSFFFNIPITLAANYLIQNKLPYDWRFLSSAVFSSLMAIYYALSGVLFG